MSKTVQSSPKAKSDHSGSDDAWIPSVCRVCPNCCGIRVRRRNGVIVNIEGDPQSPHNYGRICAKGLASVMSFYDPGRPAAPMVRTNPGKGLGIDPKWTETSWDEALELVAARIRDAVREDPRKLVILGGTGEAADITNW
ncbi:MAG: hypothetical protein HYV04_16680 [Deltaproteobacteria bacterium]|nr:hypothetical protein [Deltaproteobacteria bacterium]